VMDAKRALEQSEGDTAKAEELLREKGLASAAKRAGRAASDGGWSDLRLHSRNI